MFSWFEDRLNPFPNEEPTQPPQGLVAFCWHYAKPAGPWLFLMSAITALISIGEVYLFGFLGNIVDWLAASGQEGFLEREGGKLIWVGAVLLLGLPAIV
ncbi:MAG: ABC transporter ATP-binding protein, partial [SAR324 cluster bacterium]|nr:ABC transporter ATP-binding protein [SAR324 cluster bacterium]